MTDKELKKMSRGDLLELLISQMEENEKLRAKLHKAEKELKSRRIKISKAGSIAEAALELNGVFQAAEAAAAQYLENVRLYSEKYEEAEGRTQKTKKEKPEKIRKTEVKTETEMKIETECWDDLDVDLQDFDLHD